jgi:hypothetical protein
VTVHPLSLAYQAGMPITAGSLSGQLSVIHNLPGGKGADQSAFTAIRAGAKAAYTIVRLAGSAQRAFSNDWQLRAIVNAQYSRDELVPGEQFGAGGASSVRGFQEREIANDSGINLNLEAYTPDFCGREGWNCRLLGFYDSAYVRRTRPAAGELASTSIGSAGIGARMQLSSYLNLQLDFGHILAAGATGRKGCQPPASAARSRLLSKEYHGYPSLATLPICAASLAVLAGAGQLVPDGMGSASGGHHRPAERPAAGQKADGAARILSLRSEVEGGDTLMTEKHLCHGEIHR